MLTAIRCEDALLIHGATEDEMVRDAEHHVLDAHPQLVGLIDDDQVRETVRRAPFVLRGNGIDTSQRLFRHCPFEDLELLLVYGWKR